MKKIMYSDFKQVGGILDTVIKGSDLQAGLKKSALCKFWGNVVGKKFENYSKPYSLSKKNVLTVACANSFVTSELTMFKPDILKKLIPYTKSLEIEIEDIFFSHKIWTDERAEEENIEEPPPKIQPEINFDEIQLDENEIKSIKNCIDNNKFASPEQRERMYNAIVRDLKYQKYMQENS